MDTFSLADADELLTSSAIRTPSIRLVQDGSVLPESRYIRTATLAGRTLTGLVDPRRALALFDEGATIVFQGLHRYWSPLTRLIADLELALGHPCQANAYLTPPAAQGFAVHSDSHDVFVYQTHGHKRWELHGTADSESEEPRESEERSEPEEVTLEPGLVLYLPTGTRHAARTEDTISLHVTIGINQLTWPAVLRRAIEPVLAELGDGPGHLPAGHLTDPALLREGLADRLTALAERVRALDPDQLVRAEHERFLTTRPSRLAGGLVDRDVVNTGNTDDAGITDNSVLRRRGICRPLPPEGDRMRVLLGDRHLDVPAWLEPAFARIAELQRFTPADLDLDEASRLVLCRRLVREGTLAVEIPEGPA
ncbi:cupin domain-containing protein [Enemella sp. A6]|uniref:cupin domain-containing protein n=1 Tax=Enemella sp. A6 TaxID=3440152 RepID=UPI003EB83C44